jgi:hypothetical protein
MEVENMGRSEFFDEGTERKDGPKDQRHVRMSEVIDALASRHSFKKVTEETASHLRQLAEAIEKKDPEDNLQEIINLFAKAEICLDTYMQWWVTIGGVDFDEHKDKARMETLIKTGRSMIG